MPDLPIVLPDTAAAPKDYTLSGAQELALKTVRALIDGSGAGSPFLPTLQLLDPNGHVMWEGATQSTVAAGGSADVSWFPGLGASSNVTPPPAGSGIPYAVFGTSSPVVNLNSGVFTILDLTTGAPAFTLLDTSDSTMFGIAVGMGGNHGIQLKQDGLYVLHCVVQMTIAGAPAAGSGALAVLEGGAAYWPVATTQTAPWIVDVGAGGTSHAEPQPSAFISVASPNSPAPVTMNIAVRQNSGSTTNQLSLQGVVYQANPTGATDF